MGDGGGWSATRAAAAVCRSPLAPNRCRRVCVHILRLPAGAWHFKRLGLWHEFIYKYASLYIAVGERLNRTELGACYAGMCCSGVFAHGCDCERERVCVLVCGVRTVGRWFRWLSAPAEVC